MKKLIAMALASVMLLAGCGGGSSEGASSADAVEKYGSDTLKLYNWGEYMGEDLISNFEKEFGVKVIVEYSTKPCTPNCRLGIPMTFWFPPTT